jgi:hypothetical protein
MEDSGRIEEKVNVDIDDDLPERRLPTAWQKCFGIVAVLFTLLAVAMISTITSALERYTSQLIDPPFLPFTPAIIQFGRILNDFWFVPVTSTIVLYVFWIMKNARRMLWFNALASVVFPLALWFTFSVVIDQHDTIVFWIRQQRAAGKEWRDLYRNVRE